MGMLLSSIWFTSANTAFVTVKFIGIFQTTADFLSAGKVVLNVNSQFVFIYRLRFSLEFIYLFINLTVDFFPKSFR